jgi:hypothetical protein
MPCAAKFALIALSSLLLPARGVAQIMAMPKAEDGYTITKTDAGENAPPNYEGRTDDMSQTAVGNTDATRRKRYFIHVKLANKVKTCPKADGEALGEGEMSADFDYTDSTTGASEHDEMHAIAKYKGKVGDNAWLDGPITADVDYSFTKSGTSARGSGEAPPSGSASQHITVTFVVLPGGEPPKFDAFSGGDANLPGLSQAYGAAAPLGFFAGYYYSIAETKWLHGLCVRVVFDPPSKSRQPALGSKLRILGYIKTWGGEGVRGLFPTLKAYSDGGSVESGGSSTDGNSPAYFFYTAPATKVDNAGFKVTATSRAGAAEDAWVTTLGTGWSGEISASRVTSGDEAHSDYASLSNYESIGTTVEVTNGVGSAVGYSEFRSVAENRHSVVHPGGSATIEFDNGSSANGQAMNEKDATADVTFNETDGTYTVTTNFAPFAMGKMQSSSCIRTKCTTQNQPYGIQGILGDMSGKTDDRNHVQGSKTVVTPNVGTSRKGTQTYTLRWDLSRQGTTK